MTTETQIFSTADTERPALKLNLGRAIALSLAGAAFLFAPLLAILFWDAQSPTLPFATSDYWVSLGYYAVLASFGLVATFIATKKSAMKILLPVAVFAPIFVTALYILFQILGVADLGGQIFASSAVQLLLIVAFATTIAKTLNYKIGGLRFKFSLRGGLAVVGLWLAASFFSAFFTLLVEIVGPVWLTREFYEGTNFTDTFALISNASLGAGELALLGVGLVVFVPIVEEFVFRGVMLGGLRAALPRRMRYLVLAVLVSSLIFTIVHIVPFQFVPIFFLSLALSVAYWFKGIWYATILHALQNGLSFTYIVLAELGIFDINSFLQ